MALVSLSVADMSLIWSGERQYQMPRLEWGKARIAQATVPRTALQGPVSPLRSISAADR